MDVLLCVVMVDILLPRFLRDKIGFIPIFSLLLKGRPWTTWRVIDTSGKVPRR